MVHSFIVYQYGKVASSSLVETLNKLRDVEAYQCHFLGPDAFSSILERLCKPGIDDYFFEHSLGQLSYNLRAYRSFARRNEPGAGKCTVVSVAREPMDWYRSSLVQEIEGHLPALRHCLESNGQHGLADDEVVRHGVEQLIARIHATLDTVASLDDLTVKYRRALDQRLAFADSDDFENFLFLLGRFLMPHFWFNTQFRSVTGVDITTMSTAGEGLLVAPDDGGNIYLMSYEKMESAFEALRSAEGLGRIPLVRTNEASGKPYAEEVASVFESPEAQRLKARATSRVSGFLDDAFVAK